MPACADSPSPPRTSRWVLVWQNAVVANAAALLVGCGGLRTPYPAVNLWSTAGLLLWPTIRSLVIYSQGPCRALRGALQQHAERHIHDGPVARAAFVVIVSLLIVSAVATIVVPLLIGAAMLAFKIGTSVLPAGAKLPPWSAPLAQGIFTLALLGTIRTARTPSACLAQHALRALAWLPPIAWSGMLAFSCLWTPGAWIGFDPMFEPIARRDHGWCSYVAVRVNPAAFRPFHIDVMSVTPIVPGVLGFWRVLHRERASDATLTIADDATLVVIFEPQDPGRSEVRIPLP
jgi:hypothetical protein